MVASEIFGVDICDEPFDTFNAGVIVAQLRVKEILQGNCGREVFEGMSVIRKWSEPVPLGGLR